MTTPRLPVSFSEQDAQRILARAAELEATVGGRLSIDDLRQIAAKAGIDSAALEHAIREAQGCIEEPNVYGSPAPLMTRKRFGVLAGIGALLGVMAIGADRMNFPFTTEFAVLGPSALFAAYLTLTHPKRDGMVGLMRELAVCFGSFTVAVIAQDGLNSGSLAIAWSLLCSILAGGVMALRTGPTERAVTDPTRAITPIP